MKYLDHLPLLEIKLKCSYFNNQHLRIPMIAKNLLLYYYSLEDYFALFLIYFLVIINVFVEINVTYNLCLLLKFRNTLQEYFIILFYLDINKIKQCFKFYFFCILLNVDIEVVTDQ